MYIANTISYDIHWQSLQFLQAHDLCCKCSQKNAVVGQYEREPSLSKEECAVAERAPSAGAQGNTRKETKHKKGKNVCIKLRENGWQTHTTQRMRQGDSNLYDTTERQKYAQLILICFYGAYRAKRIRNTLFPQIAWNSLWLIMLLDPAMCPRFSEVFICLARNLECTVGIICTYRLFVETDSLPFPMICSKILPVFSFLSRLG